MRKLWTLLMVLVMGLMVISCDSLTEDKKDDTSSNTEDDSTLFEQNDAGLLLVTNNGSEDLVLFYDSVRPANLIGGIRGLATRHRVRLPESGKLYVVHAVRYSEYKAAKGSEIGNLKVISSDLAYSDSTNETSCELGNAKYTGNCELSFQNQTQYYVEVGNGSANDEDLFYTMRPNSKESIFVDEIKNGYTLYMILNLPIKKNGKIVGIQRRFVEEWANMYQPTPSRVTPVVISSTEIAVAKATYTEGYVKIINNFNKGFNVNNGSTMLFSTLEHGVLASGEEEIYQLAGSSDGRPYSQMKLIAATASNNKAIPEFAVKNGYKYVIEIKSDGTIEIAEKGEIDPEEEEIIW